MENNVRNIEKTLKQLNTYSIKPRRKLSLGMMEINKKYTILSARKTLKLNKSKKTVVRLEVEDAFIYLPVRFNQLPNSVWIDLSNGNFEICQIGYQNRSWHLTFSCAKDVEADKSHQFNVLEYLNNFSYSPSYKEMDNESSKQFANFTGQVDESFTNI